MRPGLILVDNLAGAMLMREIRNDCRQFMTRNPLEISHDEQEHWYQTLDRATVEPYLFVNETGLQALGYGLLRLIDGRWWVSGGLATGARGRPERYGKQLFAALTERVHAKNRTAWLEVRHDNGRAESIYRDLGYVVAPMSSLNPITMCCDPPVRASLGPAIAHVDVVNELRDALREVCIFAKTLAVAYGHQGMIPRIEKLRELADRKESQ